MPGDLDPLLEVLPLAIGVVDSAGRITYFNPAFTRLFGYTVQDVPTLDAWWTAAYPDSTYRQEVMVRWAASVRDADHSGGIVGASEYRVTSKSGEARQVHIFGAILGERVYAIFHDLSDIRVAERRYRDQLEFSEAVIHSAADGIAACYDIDEPPWARFTVWSRRMKEITGYTMDQINANGWFQTLYPDPAERMRAVLRMQRMRDGEQGNLAAEPWTIRNARGEDLPVAISTSLVPSEDGRVHVLGIIRDRSAEVEAEAERHAFEQKLWETQRLEALGVLAGGIAHDFNNLLVAILGHADLARPEAPPHSALGRRLEAIRMAAMRASELTNQLLAYSGKGRFVVEPTDLNGLIDEMGELLTTSLPKTIELAIHLDEALPRVVADGSQMRQVVMNLLTNAAEASEGGAGRVQLTTRAESVPEGDRRLGVGGTVLEPGLYAVLRVEDRGQGMDEETLAHIFEPFFTTKFTGRGLGLAAVLGIVRGHRGGLFVDSTPGEGTRFELWLPGVDAPQDERDTLPSPGEPSLRGLRALVVDDEPAVRTTTQLLLEELGLEVVLAEHGEAGIAVFDREGEASIDLVLLDLTMPRGGGEAALRALRERRADLPVVVMSGYSPREMSTRVGSWERIAFLQKPFTFDRLTHAIQTVTGGSSHRG